jgi:Fibronectin type III domain
MPGFKAVIDAYTAAAAAAQHDGGRNSIIERDKRRRDALLMYRLLGRYVEVTCKNDLKTFASSGFTAASTGQRTPAQPVAVPLIISVDQGKTGQLLVTFRPVAHARHYEVRYAAVPAAGAAVNWMMIVAPSTKPPTTFNNLTPGTTYTFQVRAFGKLGFSDWSASVERMCI